MGQNFPRLATTSFVIIVITAMSTSALADDSTPSSPPNSQTAVVKLPYPLSAGDAFDIVENEGAAVVSATQTIDKAIAVYRCDDSRTASANATIANRSLTDLVGGVGVVTSVEVIDLARDNVAHSGRSVGSEDLADRIEEAARK